MTGLERRWRRLLLAYPAWYRRGRGEAIGAAWLVLGALLTWILARPSARASSSVDLLLSR